MTDYHCLLLAYISWKRVQIHYWQLGVEDILDKYILYAYWR